MQDHPSGPSPRDLICAEIEETGQHLARLIQVGRSLDRSRRSEIRALLREAFHTTQVDCSLDALQALRRRLLETHEDLGGSTPSPLSCHLEQIDRISRFDERMGARGGRFEGQIEGRAERMVDHLEARINRTLSATPGGAEAEQSGESRPLRTTMEMMELVVKKMG